MTIVSLVQGGLVASIVLTVIAVGLAASPGDATSLFRAPGQLLRSLSAMMFIVPIFAIVIARAFELEPAVKIALGALSISPVPPLWPNRSRNAGGNATYTVGLLVATAVLSIFIVPLSLDVFQIIFDVPLVISQFRVAELALGTVVIPVLIGIGVKRFATRFAYRAVVPLRRFATALLVVSVAPVLFTAWPSMTSLVGDGTLLTMIAFVVVGLVAGHVLGGPPSEDRTVLALASAARHPGIALVIAQANFPTQKLIPAAILLYLLVSFATTTLYVRWSRRHIRHEHRPLMALR